MKDKEKWEEEFDEHWKPGDWSPALRELKDGVKAFIQQLLEAERKRAYSTPQIVENLRTAEKLARQETKAQLIEILEGLPLADSTGRISKKEAIEAIKNEKTQTKET